MLISDYDKGVCTPACWPRLSLRLASCGIKVLADPIRGRDYRKYIRCSAITPNRLEAGLATGHVLNTTTEALESAALLREQLDLEAAIVTLDKEGMALVHSDGRGQVFPTRPRQVYDITGAGDMVMAVLGMALAAGADYGLAIRLANIAGGFEVEKIGVVTLTREEILCDLLYGAPAIPTTDLAWRKTAAGGVGCTNCGAARPGPESGVHQWLLRSLHAGHIQYLLEARAQGDALVVGLNSDASVRALKGPTRPVNSVEARACVLSALQMVDYVTVFNEATPLELIDTFRPDVLVKGADYHREQVVGGDLVESYGGRVHLAPDARGVFDDTPDPRLGASIISCRGFDMKIAVVLPGWIGDAVMATPALRALRSHFRRRIHRRHETLCRWRPRRRRLVRRTILRATGVFGPTGVFAVAKALQ